VRKDPCNTWFK